LGDEGKDIASGNWSFFGGCPSTIPMRIPMVGFSDRVPTGVKPCISFSTSQGQLQILVDLLTQSYIFFYIPNQNCSTFFEVAEWC